MSKTLAHSTENSDRTEDVIIRETTTFESLLLPENLINGLKKNGFFKPSPIQLKALPVGRCGFDLIVKSKSGTGKTLIFTVIALENIDVKKECVQVLIVAPAREIAVQIEEVIKLIGCDIQGLHVKSFIGGLSVAEDKEKCKSCHIAIGTPGRLKHLMDSDLLKLNNVRLFVLDEVDKLIETTFLNDINAIYNNLHTKKQLITTSATYPEKLQEFLSRYMVSPTFITAEVKSPLLLGLKQYAKVLEDCSNIVLQMRAKTEELINIFSCISFTQCLVFTNYQSRAESISNILNQKGWCTTFLSGAQSQSARLSALKDLKEFKSRILLTTDLAARGIDAANVDLVLNYDIPVDALTYLHRMGRAGRYGSSGVCINLAFNGKELIHLQNILGCIGGTELGIPNLPTFTGSLADLMKVEIEQDQYIPAVVNDKIEDLVRGKIFELKLQKYEQNDLSLKSIKKDKKVSKAKATTTITNLLDNKTEMEIVKKKIENMDTDDILNSLADGTFDFGQNDSLTKSQQENENKLSYVTASNQDKDTMESIKDLLSPNPNEMHISDGRKSSEKTTDKNQDILCKNKALFAISKTLNSPGKKGILEDEAIQAYLDQIKEQEKKVLSFMTKKDIIPTVENLEEMEKLMISPQNETSLFPMECEQKYTKKSDNTKNTSTNRDADASKKTDFDFDSIFKLGYESIVKSDGSEWRKWLASQKTNVESIGDIMQEEYETSESEEMENCEEEVEIMKWVPVEKNTKSKKTKKNKRIPVDAQPSTTTDNLLGESSSDAPQRHACVVEADAVDQYEHFSKYFDHCSDTLWQNGLTFDSVERFDEWFSYEWEAQLASVRNYVQQNIYVQEMSNFQNRTQPRSRGRPY